MLIIWSSIKTVKLMYDDVDETWEKHQEIG